MLIRKTTNIKHVYSFTNKNRAVFLLFLFSSISLTAKAQNKEIKYSNQQWFQYYNQLKLSEKWTWLSDGGYRLKDGFKHSSQYIARTGFGYRLNSGIRLVVGFANLGFYTSGQLTKIEFRPYQELLIKQKFSGLGMGHRFRVEQRFFRPIVKGNIQDEGSFNFRFRYRFLVSIPIMKLSSSNADKKLLLNLGDEIFINTGKEIVYNIFSQNRILLGTCIKFSNNFAISFTYNHQFISSNSPNDYKQDYVFWLGIKQTMDFTNLL